MATVLRKEGSKLHLVNEDGVFLCTPFKRGPDWIDYELKTMTLKDWNNDPNRCYNCWRMFQLWAFHQFEGQIIDFIDASGFARFPHKFEHNRWKYANTPRWPTAKIIKGDGYKRR